MMLGKPIIVARNTNIDRIVERYENGLVVEYGKVYELENALSLLCDPEKRKAAGMNSRRAYEQEYGWGKMKSRLIDIYRGLAAQ
jgi:glycosyltransferase involved in cell wall biosynthesis